MAKYLCPRVKHFICEEHAPQEMPLGCEVTGMRRTWVRRSDSNFVVTKQMKSFHPNYWA